MATRKILFVLSLALLINPALHCMEDDMAKNVVKVLTLGAGLACAGIVTSLKVAYGKAKIEHMRRGLSLPGFKWITVFTSGKLDKQYKLLKKTNEQLDIYGIVKSSTRILDIFEVNEFYKDVVDGLLPRWYQLIFGKVEYKLDDENKISRLIYNCMKKRNLEGIVALRAPKKEKTLVVSSGDNYNAYYCVDRCVDREKVYVCYQDPGVGYEQYGYEDKDPSVEKIKEGIFKHTNDGHIVLTKNISQQSLKKALKNNPTLSKNIDNYISKVNKPENSDKLKKQKYLRNIFLAVQNGLSQYQGDIINKIFPEDADDSFLKEDKEISMIPSQHFYFVKEIKEYVPLFGRNSIV